MASSREQSWKNRRLSGHFYGKFIGIIGLKAPGELGRHFNLIFLSWEIYECCDLISKCLILSPAPPARF